VSFGHSPDVKPCELPHRPIQSALLPRWKSPTIAGGTDPYSCSKVSGGLRELTSTSIVITDPRNRVDSSSGSAHVDRAWRHSHAFTWSGRSSRRRLEDAPQALGDLVARGRELAEIEVRDNGKLYAEMSAQTSNPRF